MDLKKKLVQPIITGAVVVVITFVVQWILGAIGFTPIIALQVLTYAVSIPGLVGTVIAVFVIGYIIPIADKQAEGLAGKT